MRYVAVLTALALASPAVAGPPYLTDDPQPTELHRWEIYAFAAATRFGRGYDGVTGFDVNYGGLPGVQLTATLPLEFGSETRLGGGDIEIGAKYRFFHDAARRLAVAIFPRIILPTARSRSAPRRAVVLLPVWGQQDFGRWSLFGGGGYTFNPGDGNRDFAQAGLALTRDISDRLSLGGEVFWRQADVRGAHNYAALNIGGSLALGGPFNLLFSGGPGLSHAGEGGRFNGYVALLANF